MMPVKLSHQTALRIAEEFTKIALEKELIAHSSDPSKGSTNVVNYFNAIYDSLHADTVQVF